MENQRIFRSLTVTLRDSTVQVKVLNFLTVDPIMPIVVIRPGRAGLSAISVSGGDLVFRNSKAIIVAEELSIFFYGKLIEFLRFRYANVRVPRHPSQHELDAAATLKLEIAREAELAKRKKLTEKVDLYPYYYNLSCVNEKAVKEFLRTEALDKRTDL